MKANYKADYLVESDKVDKNYSKDNAVNYLVTAMDLIAEK